MLCAKITNLGKLKLLTRNIEAVQKILPSQEKFDKVILNHNMILRKSLYGLTSLEDYNKI